MVKKGLGQALDKHDAICYHLNSCKALEGLGNFSGALEHHKAFFELNQAVFSEESAMKSRALEITHQIARMRQESIVLKQKNSELEQHLVELKDLHEQLHEVSIKDSLTGLYNRRYLFSRLDHFVNLSRRYKNPLAVVMLDIDHFKQINDNYGHKVGDDVLRSIAEILRPSLRDADVLARYGGEEFAILMPETELSKAIIVCERIRMNIADYEWQKVAQNLNVTGSLGISTFEQEDCPEKLFVKADECLYEAKRSGRNKTISRLKLKTGLTKLGLC